MLYDTQALKQQARDHLWMAYQPPVPFEAIGCPTVIVEAEGCVMFDSPLIISREEVEQLVGIVDRALARYEETN